MPIYTKTGDKGTTSLWGGKRVSKADLQIEAYGSADELTSRIGYVVTKLKDKRDKKILTTIQRDLHDIMAFMANAKVDIVSLEQRVKSFEQNIDKMTSRLPKLNSFIIPGGTEIAGLFHLLRTGVRNTERRTIAFLEKQKKLDNKNSWDIILIYLNRLSDLFFTFARKYSKGKEVRI